MVLVLRERRTRGSQNSTKCNWWNLPDELHLSFFGYAPYGYAALDNSECNPINSLFARKSQIVFNSYVILYISVLSYILF